MSENLNSDGGDININVSQTVFTDDMRIVSLTEGNNQGGKISINKPQFVILNKSIFDSTSNQGTDGQINIDTDYFIKSVNSTLEGDVIINSGKENFSNSLENITKIFADASKLLAKPCVELVKDESSFKVSDQISEVSIADLLKNPQPASAQNIQSYQSFQKQLNNAITAEQRAKILSKLATLYKHKKRYSEALQLNQQALLAIQLLNSSYWNYKLQWQRGKLFKTLEEYDNAITAYQIAIQKLIKIRPHLTKIYKENFPNGECSEFRGILKPIFTELIALLLQQPSSSEHLKQVLDIISQLKTAELQDYFQDDCTKPTIDLEKIDTKHTAIIYPIFLSDSVELLLSLSGEQRFHITVPTTSQQLTKSINILSSKLNCNDCKKDDSYLISAQQIYDWLIRPIETKFSKEINTLVFVPDGPLYSIPMAVLHDGQQFLIEKYAIAIAPNFTMPSTEKDFPPKILYSALTKSQHPNFRPIQHYSPKMQQELESIFDVTTLKGKGFISTNLEQELNINPYSMMHIFSHAQFSKQVDDTFLVTFNDKLNMEKLEELINPQQYKDTPLDLLTLSACETAKGDERAALGLAGIAYKAGTRSAVATLWNVREDMAFHFFKDFYKEIANHKTKAKAVQIAQLNLLNWNHPYYWSPFLLIGHWVN